MSRPLRIAVDFSCPASYLAVAPTRDLELRLGARLEWLPFPSLPRTRPRIVVPDDGRSARHFHMRAEYLAKDLRRYGASRGLDLENLHRDADATLASLGLLWLRCRTSAAAGDYVARVFDRIWLENAEPDMDFLENALGCEARGFRAYATGDGPRDLEAIREQLSSEGVWNVPAYLVGDELFIGRQHLPMIEWLATTRPGASETQG